MLLDLEMLSVSLHNYRDGVRDGARDTDCLVVCGPNPAFFAAHDGGAGSATRTPCSMGKGQRGTGRVCFRGDCGMPARLRTGIREPTVLRSGIRIAEPGSLAGGTGEGTITTFEAVGRGVRGSKIFA